jgi:hypothetical protein
VSEELLRWPRSHRTTMIGTRIQGCAGHGAVGTTATTVMTQQNDDGGRYEALFFFFLFH